MNYEEKYNQALEKFKNILGSYYMTNELKKDIESVFPELVEDKDEITRKEIISWMRGKVGTGDTFQKNKEKWIAWLEKQKNVTSIENKDLSKCSDDIKDFMETFCEDEPKAYWDGCADTLEWIKTHPDNQFCKKS